jgi:hypothetical protein
MTNRIAYDVELAMNPRGDALVSFRDFVASDVLVARRSPLAPFGEAQFVRCTPPAATADAAALSPDGAGVLLSHVDRGPTEISQDNQSAATPLDCEPSTVYPSFGASRPNSLPRRARLAFTARLVGGPHLGRDRSIRLRLDCNQPCLVKGHGSMKLPRKRRALPFSPAETLVPRSGTKRLTLTLNRQDARRLRRSAQRRRARGTIRLRAQSWYGDARSIRFAEIRP